MHFPGKLMRNLFVLKIYSFVCLKERNIEREIFHPLFYSDNNSEQPWLHQSEARRQELHHGHLPGFHSPSDPQLMVPSSSTFPVTLGASWIEVEQAGYRQAL